MKRLFLISLITGAIVIGVGAMALATTSGSAAVTFTVVPTQELTANALTLGSVSAGTNNLGSKTPVTVGSNSAWHVTAQAAGPFTAGAQSIPASNLSLGGASLSTTPTAAVTIASGVAGSSSPAVATVLNVPWTIDPGVSSAFSGSVTYAILPN
ncbi:MAG: hypothetical protein Q8L35_01010 [Actinomycetota bacterium]|nr:hypothetical protein [Actinomycetota bacterium]